MFDPTLDFTFLHQLDFVVDQHSGIWFNLDTRTKFGKLTSPICNSRCRAIFSKSKLGGKAKVGKYATLRVHHKKSHVKDAERGEVAKRSSKGERELFQAEKSRLQVKKNWR